jgi:Pyridoxamine 5'-phosphate oxidase
MSKPPLPEAAVAMLRKPNPAVITTPRRDGQPVAAATWYLWDDGRVLVSMDEGRKRLEHMRDDPQVVLDVLDEGYWFTHVTSSATSMRCGRTPAWPTSTAWPSSTLAGRTCSATAAGPAPRSPLTAGTAGVRSRTAASRAERVLDRS